MTKAAVGTAAAIVELDGFETTPEPLPAGQFLFRGYQEGAAEFWKWDKDHYVGPDAADGAGWLKK